MTSWAPPSRMPGQAHERVLSRAVADKVLGYCQQQMQHAALHLSVQATTAAEIASSSAELKAWIQAFEHARARCAPP